MTNNFAEFREIFARIGLGTQQRENDGELPREQVQEINDRGFTKLRVPTDFGGFGLGWEETTELLIELATADSNIPQIYRGHLAVVEDARFQYESHRQLAQQDSDLANCKDQLFKAQTYQERLRWFAQGKLVGNAWTEPGKGSLTQSQTKVKNINEESVVVEGEKLYTTGSIFADYLDVTASNESGQEVTVLLPRDQEGVTVYDDWDGFGQQQTGTGAAVFRYAYARADQVRPFSERFGYQTALYQHVLNIAQVGNALNAAQHLSRLLAERTRSYSHGNGPLAHEDPQLLEVAGRLFARAEAAKDIVVGTAKYLDRAADSARGSATEQDEASAAVERATARAQLVVNELALANGTQLFDALGASAVRRGAGLDRYWRNSRTIASHNPQVYKARILGDWAVNGKTGNPLWTIGVAEAVPTTN